MANYLVCILGLVLVAKGNVKRMLSPETEGRILGTRRGNFSLIPLPTISGPGHPVAGCLSFHWWSRFRGRS